MGLFPGQKIGRYIVEQALGQGGMGSVYKGRDTLLNIEVAIKEINPLVAQTQEGIESFKEEAKLAIALRHPAIVGFIDFIIQDHTPAPPDLYLVTQFVEGKTLESVIAESALNGNYFSQDKAIEITLLMLEGLGYAHQHGVVHRDLKPANVMIDPSGKVTLIDFGIARTGSSGRTQFIAAGAFSLYYSPPEQTTGMGTSAMSDFYAVGVLLYEMMTGQVQNVFPARSNERLQNDTLNRLPHISREMEQVILKAVAVNPSYRYQSAAEFSAALSQLKGQSFVPPGPQFPPSAPQPPQPPVGPTIRRTNLDIRRT